MVLIVPVLIEPMLMVVAPTVPAAAAGQVVAVRATGVQPAGAAVKTAKTSPVAAI